MGFDFVKTRDDAERLPQSWYTAIENTRNKARKFMHAVVAIDQKGSLIIGKLIGVEIDRLFNSRYPYCRVSIKKGVRFNPEGKQTADLGETEMFFINKPEMVMSVFELGDKFPKVFEEMHIIKKRDERWL